MGGSGGGFFGRKKDPKTLSDRLRQAEAKTLDEKWETQVNDIISSLLPKINRWENEAIGKHLETIRRALGKEIAETIDLLYGGSVAKHTYVDGLSDIDALVILNKTELKDWTPQKVKKYLFSCIKDRFPKTPVKEGDLAITIKFKDAEIQLLPAVRYKSGIRIADSAGKDWAFIKPKEFSDLLTKVNSDTGYKVVPIIKLSKSIISGFPKNRRLSGYHVEALSVEIFREYDGPKTPKAMLKHFFSEAPKLVLSPITDRTGQSLHVDDYLGPRDSLERKMVTDSLSRVGRRMQNADGAHSLDEWRNILGIS